MTSTQHTNLNGSPTANDVQDGKFYLIGRIASGLAHELNGPIGIALGFSELARESLAKTGESGLDAEGVKKVDEYLGLVENAGIRARSLARQIWNFAKAEPGTTSNFDLVEALQDVAALAAPAVKVGQVEVSQRGEATSSTPVRGDQPLFTYALVRLLLDSVQALPQGGSVYWEIGGITDGMQQFTLAAEPWGDVPSAEWPVQESTKDAFRRQGGSVGDAAERMVEGSQENPTPSSPGWYVQASLPVADN